MIMQIKEDRRDDDDDDDDDDTDIYINVLTESNYRSLLLTILFL